MTVINTNVGAITERTYATNSSSKIEDNLEKLSSGRRVNSGSDDAAGLAVAYKLEAQLRSTNMAIQNASNGVSLIQTAGSGMNKVNSMLASIPIRTEPMPRQRSSCCRKKSTKFRKICNLTKSICWTGLMSNLSGQGCRMRKCSACPSSLREQKSWARKPG